jgi:hypothetical protein
VVTANRSRSEEQAKSAAIRAVVFPAGGWIMTDRKKKIVNSHCRP